MSNAVHILKNFKSNTDAIATNQGFYYQYLVTLSDWLGNYLNGNNIDIYCEMDDDIRAHDLSKNHIDFTQVKAYAADFTISSNEIKKAVVNFFHLYIDYKDKEITSSFIFHTNSDFIGDYFESISDGKVKLTEKKRIEYIEEIKAVLLDKFREIHKKEISKLREKITIADEYITKYPTPKANQKKKWDKSEKESSEAKIEKKTKEDEFEELQKFIIYEAADFVDRIEWHAEKKDKDDAIGLLKSGIANKIEKIDGFKIDPVSAYSHLIYKVIDASQSLASQSRKLNAETIDGLIKDAKEVTTFRNALQSAELQPVFSKLNEAQILQLSILENLEEGQVAIKQDTAEILTLLQQTNSEFNHAPHSFTDFERDVFSYTEQDFYKKSIRKLKDLTPKNIFDNHAERLFYPYEPNVNSVIEQLSKEAINNKLWIGWLELLVLVYLQNNQKPDLNNIKIKINNSEEAIIKSYFTNKKNYADFIEYLLDDDVELVEDRSCLLFNSNEPLRPHVYPKNKIKNIVYDIYSDSSFSDLNPLSNKRFGIMHFEKIRDTIAGCDNKNEIITEIKELINDVVS